MPWLDELLPTAPQEYVRDVSERTQCPPDFVGGALIVAVSTVVGRKFTVYPKQHDDWMVIPNQWAFIIGRPSATKTPALKQALRPLHALESRERNQHGQAEAQYKASSELLEMERNAAKLKAKKLLGSGDKNAALAELNRLLPTCWLQSCAGASSTTQLSRNSASCSTKIPTAYYLCETSWKAGWRRYRARTVLFRERATWHVSMATAHSPKTSLDAAHFPAVYP